MAAGVSAFRASQWWAPKLAPVLGTGYATVFLLGVSIWDHFGALLLTLAALIPGAVYAAVLNDATDLVDDRAAGKTNRFAGQSKTIAITVLLVCLCIGAIVGALAWRRDPTVAICYIAAWLAFSAYSVPPVRLKARGILGALADASGAHLLPQLLVVLVVFHATSRPVRVPWIALVGSWALAAGIRSILCHQLDDVAADRESGVLTAARRHPRLARVSGAWVFFPIEMGAFVAMLAMTRNVLAWLLLPAYGLLEMSRVRWYGVNVRLVSPAATRSIAMHDFYVVLYPLAFLVASSIRYSRDAAVLLVNMVLFPRPLYRMAVQAGGTLRRSLSALRRRLRILFGTDDRQRLGA